MGEPLILALDQGTTSTRAILFDARGAQIAEASRPLEQFYPADGWVEHDAQEIYAACVAVLREAVANSGRALEDVAAIGVTNQRETVVIWDKATGEPIHRAIVWQDRRTADLCASLRAAGHERLFTERTGLLLDPYFSGTKIAWLLQNVAGVRARAEKGELAFGTVDSWLLWRLTKGAVHRTDATNAARTLLFDIRTGGWDAELCRLLGVPLALLPEVMDCAADFGVADAEWFGAAIPILGMAGDQQAAAIGQACFRPGMIKSTYGTGCFALMNIGDTPRLSEHRLLTTIAYQFAGKRTYAFEGAIFVAGAAVQWLRDGLGIVKQADETAALAAGADPQQAVYLVPAFVGLGAPYWDSAARGALFGLTRATGPAELARAALESVGYQTADLISAMRADGGITGALTLRVDGGMTASDWTMQFLADILPAQVERPRVAETTALGAAYLAGWRAGLYPEPVRFAASWALARSFTPAMADDERQRKLAGWHDAVRRTLSG